VHVLRSSASRQQFDEFVAAVTDDLVRTGYLMTWDLAETEDLVQETLIRVARRWDRVRSMQHPAAYARRILVNLVIDESAKRKRRRDELALDDVAVNDPVDLSAANAFAAIDAMTEFRAALALLPRQQRAVLVLRYWQDLSEADVADLLGCSVGTVKKTTWRAATRLRELLTVGVSCGTAPAGSTEPEGPA
jgi:RNA polymerase sigma-70 factor (sigma-E family)